MPDDYDAMARANGWEAVLGGVIMRCLKSGGVHSVLGEAENSTYFGLFGQQWTVFDIYCPACDETHRVPLMAALENEVSA